MNLKNCVYRFKDINGQILYIGKAKDLKLRLLNHEHLPIKCYKERVVVEYLNFNTEDDTLFAEKYFIANLKPKYNEIYKDKNLTIKIKELDDMNWNNIITRDYFDKDSELIKENKELKQEILDLQNEIKELKSKNKRNAGRKNKFNSEQINDILQARNEGKSFVALAKEYNCSVGTIHKIVS